VHAQGRLESLDILRGLTVIGMIIVNAAAGLQRYPVPSPLLHSHWIGLTLADVVFPAFIFIVGVSVALSMPAARGLDARAGRRIAGRALRLIVIGIVLTNIYWLADYDANRFRWLGVLQRIGLVFAVVAPLQLLLSTRQIVWTAITALLVYSLLCVLALPDGTPANLYVPGANLAGWLDRQVLGTHIYVQGPLGYDPEGLLSTIPAMAQALLGVVAGRALASSSSAVRQLVVAGAVMIVVGLSVSIVIPVSKDLWSMSFVLLTSGIAALLLGALHEWVDRRGRRPIGTKICIAFGVNAIAAYVLHYVAAGVLNWSSFDALYLAGSRFLGAQGALILPIGLFLGLIAWVMLALLKRGWVVKI